MGRFRRCETRRVRSWVLVPFLFFWAISAPPFSPDALGATVYSELISGDHCAGGLIEVGIFVENNTTGPIQVFNFNVCWDPALTVLSVSPGEFGPVAPGGRLSGPRPQASPPL